MSGEEVVPVSEGDDGHSRVKGRKSNVGVHVITFDLALMTLHLVGFELRQIILMLSEEFVCHLADFCKG